MASAGGSILSVLDTGPDIETRHLIIGGAAATAAIVAAALCLARILQQPTAKKAAVADEQEDDPGSLKSILIFAWTCFFKPHEKSAAGACDGMGRGTQQAALESFYRNQARVYDRTRKTLLKGREDMLALVAAQLKHKAKASSAAGCVEKRIWVDVGGGTGYNIEAMGSIVSVPDFFSKIYLVDFSPSLCEIARKRFARLGWEDVVSVVCSDARTFRLPDEGCENGFQAEGALRSPHLDCSSRRRLNRRGADLITMSYSLSMIPDFYSVIDSLTGLLAPHGTIGVIDFYAQSAVDVSFRNYTGGSTSRHVNFLARTFWRAWFDVDRVSLEGARRDYLEYRFGTVLSVNRRNWTLGAIPYYIWLGCTKRPVSVPVSAGAGEASAEGANDDLVERLDALVTESPCLNPANHAERLFRAVERSATGLRRSKAFDAAVLNLAADLPLPSFFYQNQHWRIYYDDTLPKHTQFGDEYIYAFTWEDSRVDERLLNLGSDDVVLAITSAGDNILSYVLRSPARVHAVDLNPAQNHLLELKVASFAAGISYDDFWAMFGEGRHANFCDLLISRLSPHLSSQAFQYWLSHTHVLTGKGLYDSGGSRHGIRVFRWLSHLFGVRGAVEDLLKAPTLNEQREVWHDRIRPAILSRLVARLVVSQEAFLWAALGVPRNQLAMIEADHAAAAVAEEAKQERDGDKKATGAGRTHAVWRYMVSTLDPVVEHTHICTDNPYYLVCLQGKFSRKCHPDYLSPQAHARLSRPGALDGLRIHTDEIEEVLARLAPATLTVAVIMDSMDWFDPARPEVAERQIRQLSRALRSPGPRNASGSGAGGRVLLRSAALRPWYVDVFERNGFLAKCVGRRTPKTPCIDRVNMYASCWILTKERDLDMPPTPPTPWGSSSGSGDEIQEMTLDAAVRE